MFNVASLIFTVSKHLRETAVRVVVRMAFWETQESTKKSIGRVLQIQMGIVDYATTMASTT